MLKMQVLIIVTVLSAILTVFFIILTVKYRDYINKVIYKLEKEEKEKSLDELLDKYIVKEGKDIMKDKLSKISKIIAATEKEIQTAVKQKVKVAKAQIKAKGKHELDIISKAKEEYISHSEGLRSAMPETEEERIQDMDTLKDAISMLESFDEETYRRGAAKTDAGLGMFYDKMSQRFLSIIDEHKLKDNKFVPIQRIKYHAFQNIRNIKNSDILPIVNVMKDTRLLNDIIEINPQFQIVVFSDEELKFTLPEKVLLTFAYDEDFLSIEKLMEITEWKKPYATKIINGLKKKEFITVLDENIDVPGFGYTEQRKKWDETIETHIQEGKAKEEEKRRRQQERAKKLKQQLAAVRDIKPKEVEDTGPELSRDEILESLDDISAIDEETPEEEPPKKEFGKKPAVKILPLPKKVSKKEVQDIKDKDALIGAMEALDEELKVSHAEAPLALKDLKDEEPDLEDLIPQKILNYHEKYSLVNGGITQYEKIKEYVDQELEDVPEELFKTMLEQLKELQMIQSSMKIGKYTIYLFKEIKLNANNKKFIQFAINKKLMNKEEFIKGLKWTEAKVLSTMKDLQGKEILRIEKDKIVIPGIKQKE